MDSLARNALNDDLREGKYLINTSGLSACRFAKNNRPNGVQHVSRRSRRVPSIDPLKLLARISRFSKVTLSRTWDTKKIDKAIDSHKNAY